MNLDKAGTRGQRNMWAFHTRFNSTLKVATCGLQLLRREVDCAEGPQVLNTVLRETDEQWNDSMILSRPLDVIDHAIRDESLLGIAHVFSAFDEYMVRGSADLQSWQSVISKAAGVAPASVAPSELDHDDGESVGQLASFAQTVGFRGNLADRAPLEHYMRLVRNCTVHREGRASRALVTFSESRELTQCHADWSTASKRPLPQLPALEVGDHIEMRPRHAILASGLCFDIVRRLDTHLVQVLGVNGLTYLAARDTLLKARYEEWGAAYKSPEAVVANTLKRVHYASHDRKEEIPRILKQLGVWDDCRKSYLAVCAQQGISD